MLEEAERSFGTGGLVIGGREIEHVQLHAEFDVEIIGAAGEQFDEAGRGVLGEEARRGDAQQPATPPRLADFEDRAVLQAQQLGGAAGQPQPSRSEREAGGRPGEQPIAEFLAQLPDVQGHRRLRHGEFAGSLLHRAEPHNGGKSPQLGRCHRHDTIR